MNLDSVFGFVKKILRSLCLVFISLSVIITLSTVAFPFQGKKLCPQASFFKEKLIASTLDRVIQSFNKHGVPFQLSCGFNSIKLLVRPLEDEILAQALPFGIVMTLHPKFGYKQDIFIPYIHPLGRRIEFSSFYLSKYRLDNVVFEATLIHELGHILGAPHIHNKHQHIMYPYINSTYSIKFNTDGAVRQVLELSKPTTWISF